MPQQKPEWKRYKQYTRTDILSAIECVRNGMSALQAARKFGVPSRTLYDKVKKLGITTGRPMNRQMKNSPSNGSSPAAFPYGLSGTSSTYSHHDSASATHSQQHHNESGGDRDMDREHNIPPPISHPAAALLDATFLQQALEARGGDIAGREALHAMAFAAAAHAAVNGMSTSPGTHGTARSPSPSILMKYMRPPTTSPPNHIERDHRESSLHRQSVPPQPHTPHTPHTPHNITDEDDRVEDLSMSKKDLDKHNQKSTPMSTPTHTPSPPPTMVAASQPGVIMPPMIMTKVPSLEETVNIKREQVAGDDDHL